MTKILPDLRSARLWLRRPVPEDAAAIAAALADFNVTGWLAVVPYPYSPADATWFIDEVLAGRQAAWIIDDGALAGVIGLDDELGYWLAARAHGRGYATEAARAVLDWAFDQGITEVHSGHFIGNRASARVLAKLGFRPTNRRMLACRSRGEEVESQGMCLTRTDWLQSGFAQVSGGQPTPGA